MITREMDYSIRLLRGLSDGELHTAAELASSQDVPKTFAYKILEKMQKAGAVRAERRKGGGYILTADLDELTLMDCLRLEGLEVWVNACVEPGFVCRWKESQIDHFCSVHQHLQQIQDKLVEELEKYSVREILEGKTE